ncbi:Hypothetical predicted protein [Octopus vulgaris]|uniref:Uncharacterized protein n=1 Tax=Octopus vulgaris TaxID=6645 RepID=A0AA36BBZ6_OCTVU|nr:Hypothetical predicted protein [Octopus vulgaris]
MAPDPCTVSVASIVVNCEVPRFRFYISFQKKLIGKSRRMTNSSSIPLFCASFMQVILKVILEKGFITEGAWNKDLSAIMTVIHTSNQEKLSCFEACGIH